MTTPDWLVDVVRLKPVRTPWARMIRAPLAICVPLTVALATGRLEIALPIALGGLSTTLVERGGPYLGRVRRVATVGVLGGALGLTVGLLVHGRGWITVIAVMGLALVSAAMSAGGNVGSVAGLQLLLFAILATGPLGLLSPWWMVLGLFLVGVAWGLGLSAVGWLFLRGAPEERSVATAYRAIAAMLREIGSEAFAVSRRELHDALATAYDDVLSARALLAGQSRPHARLVNLLTSALPLADAALTLAQEGNRPPREIIDTVDRIAEAIEDGGTDLGPAAHPGDNDSAGLRALEEQIRAIAALLTGRNSTGRQPELARAKGAMRYRQVLGELRYGRFVRTFALRLTLCIGVAAVISEVLVLQRSYWVMLTVAVVLKPDFGSVLSRALQRGLGTIVGVVVGAALLAIIPYGPLLLIPVTVLALLLPYGVVRNYGLFTAFLTPLIVVLIDLLARGGWKLAEERLIDTVIGCAVVLLLGYLPWPSSWYAHLGPHLAQAATAVGQYLSGAFDPAAAETAIRRRQAYHQVADLRTDFQRALTEPRQVSRQVTALYPGAVALEEVVDAITATATATRQGALAPSGPAIRTMVTALDEVSTAIADNSSPPPRALPDEPAAQPIANTIRRLQEAVYRSP